MKDEVKERSSIDDIIELYKKDVDRTLLRENLIFTPTERMEKLMGVKKCVERLRRAGYEVRRKRRRR